LFAGIREDRLDIVVNNAAILAGTLGTVTEERFDGGRIINISSAVVRIALPDIVYSMTKGALDTLGFSLAPILGARNITVNTVSPGVTETDMNACLRDDHDGVAEQQVTDVTALGRIGRPEDIADAVACSPGGLPLDHRPRPRRHWWLLPRPPRWCGARLINEWRRSGRGATPRRPPAPCPPPRGTAAP
jgi:NAD(P)-dependent dehydrogenase (short-subunit alcohol dehydrogenase family)